MTLPHERMTAWAQMSLLASLCQRRELEIPEFVRNIALRAFRHGPHPSEASLIADADHQALLTPAFYAAHERDRDAAFRLLMKHAKATKARKTRKKKRRTP